MMKKLLKIRILWLYILSLLFLNTAISQVGLTNPGTTQEQERNKAGVGFDYSKSESSKEQLEKMTGQKITTSNQQEDTQTTHPIHTTIKEPTLSAEQQMNIMIGTTIAESLINAIFSTNTAVDKQKELEAQKQAEALAAQKAAEQKKIEEAIAQAKYNKMMESFKTLDGSQNIQNKSLGDTKMGFKTLESEEERLKKQHEFDFYNATWVETHKQLFKERIEKPNKWADGIYNSLKTNEPPLPFKKFGELEPGDVLLFAPNEWKGSAVADISNFGQNSQKSNASHTVTYLKEENGKKIFMDNDNGEGPKIIDEDELRTKFADREASVAKLSNYGVAQPLNEKEANKLYQTAKEMEAKNIEKISQGNFFDSTNYGIDKGNMVCSEASWALIKSTGRTLPFSKSLVTLFSGVNFSPADFYEQNQYFLVTPLSLVK